MKHELLAMGSAKVTCPIDERLHHGGHATNREILPQLAHHLPMNGLWHRLHPLVEAPKRDDGFRRIATCPEKLLEVERAQGQLSLVADGKRGCIPERTKADTQQRAGTDNVKATILSKVLEGGARLGAFLDLVDEDEGVSWNESHVWHQKRHTRVHVVRSQGLAKDAFECRLPHEVDRYVAFVLRPTKRLYGKRLADLPSAVDEQALGAV